MKGRGMVASWTMNSAGFRAQAEGLRRIWVVVRDVEGGVGAGRMERGWLGESW